MKPFDLEKAKAGAPVCTKDGRDARIICFDAKGKYPIVALIKENDMEYPETFTNEGIYNEHMPNNINLMMKEIPHEGWINIYKNKTHTECGEVIYNSEEDAKKYKSNNANYITTIKITRDE